MTLVPNTPFSEGQVYTPELAYLAFNTPVFDDQPQYLGHRVRLLDSELSNDAGAIKARVAAIENSLKVTATTGLSLSVSAGTAELPNGSVVAIASTALVAPDNATSYVYVDRLGSIAIAVIPPVVRRLLAKVTTLAGVVTTVEDLRYPGQKAVSPVALSIKSFGGSNSTDKTCSPGEVFDQGTYYFRNFTVPSGVTVTVDRYAKILCSGDFTVQGTLVVTAMAPGALPTSVVTDSATPAGFLPGVGLGSNGTAYPWGAQPGGSGGRSGGAQSPTGSSWALLGAGGFGGGVLWVEAAGTINVTGTIQARGSAGGQGTTVPTYSNLSTPRDGAVSGGGGGSGGLVFLSSLGTCVVSGSGVIDVRGGDGGDAFSRNSTIAAMGGSPGAGGYLVIMAESYNTSGASLLTSGGSWGTPVNVTVVTPNIKWTKTSAQHSVPAGLGAGHGGAGGTFTINDLGATQEFNLVAAGAGQVVYRQFLPLG
jgi:hypothetical protein